MAETASTMLPLGTKAPPFELIDTRTQKVVSLDEVKSDKATVVMFICNHCPYVKHILKKVIEVANQYQQKGVSFIAINSNDITHYPSDSPDNMQKLAERNGFTFPYLFDETQEVAKSYQAACTPDFYIFDADLSCVYRGRFDDATPSSQKPVTGKELTHSLDQVLEGKSVNADQKPSLGCNIKWKN